MNIDLILDTAVKAIKSSAPDAIYQGSLIKETRAFNPSTRTNEVTVSAEVAVEIIFDAVTTEDVSGSNISDTIVKLYIIANEVDDINFYDIVRIKNRDYRISRKVENLVGSKVALFTILASIG